LDDALMHLEEKMARNVLVGGIDECTADFMKIYAYLDYWKQPISNLALLNDKSAGTIAGEGSAFFMLSAEPANPCDVAFEGVHTFFTPHGAGLKDIIPEIDTFLHLHNTKVQHLDLVLAGINGDTGFDQVYYDLRRNYFTPGTGMALYKNLCGEYYTSTSFALWLGMAILLKQSVPYVIQINAMEKNGMNKLLIYNHLRNSEHALILLSHGEI